MSHSRLTTALDAGALVLPEGPVVVLGAPAGFDLGALPVADVTIVSRFFPDAEAWTTRGYSVTQTPNGPFAAALVVVPRAKEAARALIAEAAALAPLVLVDGQKHDGIDSLLKAVKKLTAVEGTLSKAHGKLFWMREADLSEWQATSRDIGRFTTRPGVFSADAPDPASVALSDVLPTFRGHVVDLGAGWGFLSRAILTSPDVTRLDLVEADAVALDCARQNVNDARAIFHWADATRFLPEAPVDAVVSNPPFHTARAADPDLGRAFIAAAARILKPNGSFWMVANRHLPYEAALTAAFREVREVPGPAGFKLIHATKPNRAKRR